MSATTAPIALAMPPVTSSPDMTPTIEPATPAESLDQRRVRKLLEPVAAEPVAADTTEQVSLKTWAKTSRENRESKAKVAELETKLAELSKAPVATQEDAIIAELKKPGAKTLFEKAGYDFDKLVALYAGDETPTDPALIEVQKRLDAIDAAKAEEKKAKEDASAKEREAEGQRQRAAAFSGITALVTRDNVEVSDPKDERHGTTRWALVGSDGASLEQAHDAVVAFVVENKLQGKLSDSDAENLVSQALDQLELLERGKMSDRMKAIAKTTKPTFGSGTSFQAGAKTRVTERAEDLVARSKSIDTQSLRGPAPTKPKKELFSSGPRRVTIRD